MSSISLDPITKNHPDLTEASRRIDEWLGKHPHRDFLDTRAIIRDLGDRLTNDEIIGFFRALRELEIAKVGYRIVDNDGSFTRSRYPTLDDIPDTDDDRFGNSFRIERSNIVQVYEF